MNAIIGTAIYSFVFNIRDEQTTHQLNAQMANFLLDKEVVASTSTTCGDIVILYVFYKAPARPPQEDSAQHPPETEPQQPAPDIVLSESEIEALHDIAARFTPLP